MYFRTNLVSTLSCGRAVGCFEFEVAATCRPPLAGELEKQWPHWRAVENKNAEAAQKKAGIKYVDRGDAFARQTENIYWRMLTTSAPAFVKQIQSLLKSSN